MVSLLFGAQAMAQEAAGNAAQPGGALFNFIPIILIFFVFYFLVIKPQKKRLQEEQAVNAALKKGDEIYTKSGLLGTISGITERFVTLEVSDGVKVKVIRSQIAGLANKLFEAKAEKKS